MRASGRSHAGSDSPRTRARRRRSTRRLTRRRTSSSHRELVQRLALEESRERWARGCLGRARTPLLRSARTQQPRGARACVSTRQTR
ncbi:hypothetical protein ACFPRL_14595 [Pseudoclavibacter helvolus]